MNVSRIAFVVATMLATTPLFAQAAANTSPAAIEQGTYAIEPYHTQVGFSVLHMGFSYYGGRFTDVSGEVTLDPKLQAASTVRVSVPIASVSTTSTKLDAELKSADWLDAGKYPVMTFTSTTVTPGDRARPR